MFAASKTAGAVSAAPPASSDPQFNYVSLLLNDTGTNGQQNNTFLDSSSNNFTITRNGTPTQGSVTPYWPDGQWGNYFPANTSNVSVASNAAFAFPGQFTVEAWFCWTTTPSAGQVTGVLASGGFNITYNTTLQFNLFGTGAIASATFTPVIGRWYHIAMTRNSSNLCTVWIDGVSSATGTSSASFAQGAWTLYGGSNNGGAGYVSNLRIVKGTALYTSNFTPSTTPLTAVSGTSLLTCQSNRFKDNSSNNFAITVTGTPSVQAFEPFEPASSYATSVGGSGYFPGSGNYISLAGTVNQNLLGNSDFTIELWAYSATSTFNQTLLSHTDLSSGRGYGWNLRFEGSYNIKFYVGSGTAGSDNEFLTATSTGIKQNTWNHIAITRQGSSTRCFVNGVLITTVAFPATFDLTGRVPFQVGQRGTSLPEPIIGYVSNARVVAGTAVYTANFTPPTSPVTAITGTSLLLNFTNAGIYDAAVLNDLTTVGNAQVSTAQAKFGSSSMAFDGTGDYLTVPNSVNLTFGTGDFTVEAWVNLNVLGSDRSVIDFRSSVNSFGACYISGSGNRISFYDGSVTSSGTSMTSGTWNHLAWVRIGTTLYGYLNGVQQWTRTLSTNITTVGSPKVGADYNGSLSMMNGYIEDLRITRAARYTANFSVPTAPFPTR